jgi:uncharacterized protein (TIGR01777 family)
MRVIISGGTGLIGRSLSAALIADSHEVTVLSRNPIETLNMPDGVLLYRWDAQSADGWGHLVDGADAIINLAGASIGDKRWSKNRKEEIRHSRLQAGRAILEAVRAAKEKPGALIQASAVGYYGPQDNDVEITEDAPHGEGFLAGVCADWELSTAPVEKMGVRRPIIRTGVVLSPDGGALPRMARPFRFFVGGKLGSGEQWLPWIHIDDEVRAIQFLLQDEDAEGPFNLCAPNPARNREAACALGYALGRPSSLPAPAFAMKAVLGEMAEIALSGQRAIPARLLDRGFAFKHPELEAALCDLLK